MLPFFPNYDPINILMEVALLAGHLSNCFLRYLVTMFSRLLKNMGVQIHSSSSFAHLPGWEVKQ